ncbi:hypothetical protein HY450_02365 [Candidatus Pacearchaeota archaeon]|nr:hypothetical protein [Candidatus Pacearchaeota archaeon]
MFPRWHIILGLAFTLVIFYFSPGISLLFLSLLFLSSFLIDFDHYVASGLKTGKWSLKSSFEYHRIKGIEEMKEIARGIKKKSDFHLFHTIEFHIIVGLLSFFWIGFFYIFIGMVFHSLLDILYMLNLGALHRREFLFFNWIRKR